MSTYITGLLPRESLSRRTESAREENSEMKAHRKTITLRLDQAAVAKIDRIRQPLRMTRSGWLRKAVARNLQHNEDYDLPVIAGRKIQCALNPEGI